MPLGWWWWVWMWVFVVAGAVEVVTVAHAPALRAQTWHLRPLSVVAPTHHVSGGAQLSEQWCCTADL